MTTAESWVVYRMTQHKGEPMSAVCEQREWEAMEAARPGYHTLVRSGIANEAEAERRKFASVTSVLIKAGSKTNWIRKLEAESI